MNASITNLYNSNTTKMTYITYHVNWPGDNDPMNLDNPTEVQNRVDLYGVGSVGVPYTVLDGVRNDNITQTSINTNYAVASPFEITMTHSIANGIITVTMNVKKTVTTTGTMVAYIAVIEKIMNFNASNGETVHHHIFKKFLPNTSGNAISGTMAVNETVTFTQSWTYANVDNSANLFAIGFIQSSDKKIQQAGVSTLGSIPLTANFLATPTTTCDGNVQFTDKSSSNPTSWSWNFGDGTTSSLQNPSHKYSASGKYTVSLTASKTGENDSETKTDYITVNKPAKPTAQDGGGYPGSTVTLTATGTGTLKWYDVTTGGTALGTGGTFVTPPLTQDKTYYVEAATGGTISKGGKAAQGTGSYLTAAGAEVRGLVFDVLKPIILKSVKVYSQTAGNRVIQVLDAPETGNEITSTTVNIPTGEQVVTLNLSLPAGTNYHLKVKDAGTVNMWRDNAGASYPYNISDLVSIKYSNTNDPTEDYTYYYYFYDWSVAEPDCASDRTPCIANIWTVGINENESAGVPQIYPSPVKSSFNINLDLVAKTDIKVHLINTLGKIVYEYSVHNVGQLRHSVDVSSLPDGIYMVQVVYNDKCHTNKIIKE